MTAIENGSAPLVASAPGLRCRAFRLSRQGLRDDQCEDAFAVSLDRGRFAVADGATESSFGGVWANLLVTAFVEAESLPDWPEWIDPLRRLWTQQVGRSTNGAAIPWYVEDHSRQGAFATFLSLTVNAVGWSARAVGDTCLFHVRGDRLLFSFPLTQAEDFNTTPWLIGSKTASNGAPLDQALQVSDDWKEGDRLFLMTDALAQWFLTQSRDGRPWLLLEEFLDQPDEAFAAWIALLRSSRKLKNDDVTLVTVFKG